MINQLCFTNASSVSLDELASAFNAGFEGYFHPIDMTVEVLARRVRMEHIDLQQSLIAYIEQEFVGIALLGLRGREAWCGGLGIAPKFRGRGLAREIMSEFIKRARVCGCTSLRLEVLTKNTHAIRLYERAGMRVTRDLLLLERTGSINNDAASSRALQRAQPEEMLRNFERLHAWRPAWSREFASLLSADGIHCFCLGDLDNPDAYALLVTRLDGVTQILDLAASSAEHAHALSSGLTHLYGSMRVVNEPEESLFIIALTAHGFAEVDRQHEMSCELTS